MSIPKFENLMEIIVAITSASISVFHNKVLINVWIALIIKKLMSKRNFNKKNNTSTYFIIEFL